VTQFVEWLAGAAGTILLALLAGAGGSALLELIWKPRRERKRAASLLLAEVALNTQLLLMQAHARFADPTGIPADLRFSLIGWEAAGPRVGELPSELLRKIVLLYNQYRSLNMHVLAFGDALKTRDALARGSPERENAQTMLATIVDVFNTGIDGTIARGQEVIPELADLALIRETEEQKKQVVDYSAMVAEHLADRTARISAFRRRFG
jgi:hypothetical protein